MSYIPLLLTTGLVVLFGLFAWFYHKTTKLNAELGFLSNNYLEASKQNQILQQEKISYIQKIEQLSSKVDYQSQLIAEADKARQESYASAKNALFDLGNELSKQLIEIHRRENQEARELSEKNISGATNKFNNEFERLINMVGSLSRDIEQSKGTVDIIKQSLLSPSGAGLLAEITLENILKSSGLRSNLDFIIQYSVTTTDNLKLRPDALVFLPSGNLMVIDAKASKFLVDLGQDSTNLSKTMNNHLKSLNSKDYAENILASFQDKKEHFGNIVTLMFVPTEQAIEKILIADNNFLQKAWESNIFPVGPAGLMNMLSFAKFQISDYRRSENHKLIIEEVRKLLTSIASLAEHSQKLGNNIQHIVNNYDKFAASFNRHFLSKARNIQKLGIDIGNKTIQHPIERYQLVSSKSEIIDAQLLESSDKIKELE
ncbi:DNA recombination protein RmuC [Candidatus Tisiphia endosymbiont of Micropterix aruncella]|uniref:DNA recombination protein RmuC n=1 Tax=Candidatus Tisiphia endosymbiont of Micropterix aruncella TaxID=3066271 RepID=UPI003AA84B9D